jgi:hypothetical protein
MTKPVEMLTVVSNGIPLGLSKAGFRKGLAIVTLFQNEIVIAIRRVE